MNRGNAIIVKRVEPTKNSDVSECLSLARSAGYEVFDCFTQSRREDHDYNIGKGALHSIEKKMVENNCSTILFGNILDPNQMYNIGVFLDFNCEVLDRNKLVLKRLEDRASSKEDKLQITLAKLLYELPRIESKKKLSVKDEKPGFMSLGEYDENKEMDIKNRISDIKEEISSLRKKREEKLKKRKESGLGLVSLVGYTNAGKSELLRRLSESNSVKQNEDLHPDLSPNIESEEKMFTTLGTRTRRMKYEYRDILVTDTVGFVSKMPDFILNSLESTFTNIDSSDLNLLVVDASEDKEVIRDKILTTHEALREKNTNIMTVYNKFDKTDNIQEKIEYNQDIQDEITVVSARTGHNIQLLKKRINDNLSSMEEYEVELPMNNNSMSTISWLYNNTYVKNINYKIDEIIVKFKVPPRLKGRVISNIH